MFVELVPLLKERTLLITVAKVDEKVKVNVIPAKVNQILVACSWRPLLGISWMVSAQQWLKSKRCAVPEMQPTSLIPSHYRSDSLYALPAKTAIFRRARRLLPALAAILIPASVPSKKSAMLCRSASGSSSPWALALVSVSMRA